MKILWTALVALMVGQAWAAEHSHPHLPLEMTFEEYQQLNKEINLRGGDKEDTALTPHLRDAIRGGERMNAWLKRINDQRTDGNLIRLTSKKTRRGIPIDKPSKYGPATVEKSLNELRVEMPASMKERIYGQTDFDHTLQVTDEAYITYARKVSKLYQTAVRWKGLSRYLPWLTQNARRDVRGFYFLKNLENRDQTLGSFSTLDADLQTKITSALKKLCRNSDRSMMRCDQDLKTAIRGNGLVAFAKKYWSAGERTWDSFFKISNPREDVSWPTSRPELMVVPFKEPADSDISDWLKFNVEDEFVRLEKGWNMQMEYTDGRRPGTAYLEFKPNVTPHVSNGNIIIMDKNTDIQEYSVRWTIRHEFGHILRIPDCYVEFYDTDEKLMVNYQLDVTDLMCSRAGDMNDRLYEELKRVYHK